jgi:hypothetical protein
MTTLPLRMGLLGFGDENHLCNLLSTRTRLRWVRSLAIEADALWVNGAHAEPLRNHMVRVPSIKANEPATILNTKEISRPVAFTSPLGNDYFSPPHVFDPCSAESVAAILSTFEAELQQLRIELALGREIAARRYELRSPAFHLSLRGKLVGVVNITGEVGLSPHLAASDFAEVRWSGRPAAAHVIPPEFNVTTMAHVMWQYVGRSDENLLPSRYGRGFIYYRQLPQVLPRMIRDSHLVLISELSKTPQSLDQLRASTGMGQKQATETLAALYFAGSITTDPRRAAQGKPGARPADGPVSGLHSSVPADEPILLRPDLRLRRGAPDTVPLQSCRS